MEHERNILDHLGVVVRWRRMILICVLGVSLVTAGTVEALLRNRLESSGFFGARFRECAGRALLVTRNRVNERMPLWMTRLDRTGQWGYGLALTRLGSGPAKPDCSDSAV